MKKEHYGYIEGWLSIIGNVLLFVIKYWAGVVSGSVAIIADAWHTLSDSISSIIVLIGVRASSKPADEDHPFGHGRAELVSSLIIGILLLIIAYTFLVDSIESLIDKQSAVFGTLAVIVTIVSVVGKELMAQYAFYAYRKTGSTALKADAWHHRTDAISSLLILLAILFGESFWWLDGVLGILVSLMIAYTAYEIMKETIDVILGNDISEDLRNNIQNICEEEFGKDITPHHYHLHDYINHKELTFHIKLPGFIILDDAHEVATKLEKRLKSELDIIATIHMEPHDAE